MIYLIVILLVLAVMAYFILPRFKRIVDSKANTVADKLEDSVEILQSEKRKLQEKLPKLRIAKSKIKGQLDAKRAEMNSLQSTVDQTIGAAKVNKDSGVAKKVELAKSALANIVPTVQKLEVLKSVVNQLEENYTKVEDAVEVGTQRIADLTTQINLAIMKKESSDVSAEVAQTLEGFTAYDNNSNIQEALENINEETYTNHAMLDVASDSGDFAQDRALQENATENKVNEMFNNL